MLKSIYRWYAYLFGGKLFVRFNKFLYQLSLRGIGVLNYENSYLTGEKLWLEKYLKNKESPTVIDVGANVGRYTKDILSLNNSSRVWAFEPHPKTYEVLTKNVKSNNFKSYNLGVGDVKGCLKLYDYDTDDGSPHASLYKDVIEELHLGKSTAHLVDVVALDEFLQNEGVIDVIDLLKIDTEGNEFKVLLGAQKYLQSGKIKAIHFEFNEMNIVSKVSFKDFWDLLKSYKLYRILAGGSLLEIKSYSPLGCEIYAFQNIIALLRDE